MIVDYDDFRVQSRLCSLQFAYKVTEGYIFKDWAFLTGSLSGVKLHLARVILFANTGWLLVTTQYRQKGRTEETGRRGAVKIASQPAIPSKAWRGTGLVVGEQTGTQQCGPTVAANPSQVPYTDLWLSI